MHPKPVGHPRFVPLSRHCSFAIPLPDLLFPILAIPLVNPSVRSTKQTDSVDSVKDMWVSAVEGGLTEAGAAVRFWLVVRKAMSGNRNSQVAYVLFVLRTDGADFVGRDPADTTG